MQLNNNKFPSLSIHFGTLQSFQTDGEKGAESCSYAIFYSKINIFFQLEDAEEINGISLLQCVVFPLKRLNKGEVPDLGTSLGGLWNAAFSPILGGPWWGSGCSVFPGKCQNHGAPGSQHALGVLAALEMSGTLFPNVLFVFCGKKPKVWWFCEGALVSDWYIFISCKN